jgi:hypothetical protein
MERDRAAEPELAPGIAASGNPLGERGDASATSNPRRLRIEPHRKPPSFVEDQTPKQISAARDAKKAERAFFKQHAKAAKLAKRREQRESKPEPREGQDAQRIEQQSRPD